MRRIIPVGAIATLLAASMASAGTLNGQIASVDASARTLVVKETAAPRKEVRLTLTADAQVIQAGKAATIADLKAGERVQVTYTDKGAAHEASRVEVMPAKAAKS